MTTRRAQLMTTQQVIINDIWLHFQNSYLVLILLMLNFESKQQKQCFKIPYPINEHWPCVWPYETPRLSSPGWLHPLPLHHIPPTSESCRVCPPFLGLHSGSRKYNYSKWLSNAVLWNFYVGMLDTLRVAAGIFVFIN